MRFANVASRAAIVVDDQRMADLAEASGGRFGPDPSACFAQWSDMAAWVAANQTALAEAARPIPRQDLAAPSPAPTQVFAIGLNYAAHAAESGIPEPEFPTTFTKFQTCITGPEATVALPSDSVDWEIELVAVVGAHAHRVGEADAWSVVAGLTVGQDLSERQVQMRPPVPQFSLGKSFPGFGPTGPWLVTPDEFDNPDDLALSCSINGEIMQSSRTSDLIFGIPRLIQELSHITPLVPGDVIFTGTPSGVGMARSPQRFLAPGDILESTIEGVGTMTTTFERG